MTFRCGKCQGAVSVPEHGAAVCRCTSCGRAFNLTERGGPSGGALVLEARQLAFSSGIDLPAAYSVVMGLLTLDDVRRRLPEAPATAGEADSDQPASGKSGRLGWILVSVLVAAVGALAWSVTRSPAVVRASFVPVQSTVGTAEVLTDPHGRVVEVSAPDPRSVLAAYCKAGGEPGRYRVVDLLPSKLAPASERIGLLADPGGAAGLLALTIREDRARARWVAGDGLVPLEPGAAPPWASRER